VSAISTTIREDVSRVSATVDLATDRVEQVVAVAEERLGEFNALLSVVREEAEDLIVTAGSTLETVRRIPRIRRNRHEQYDDRYDHRA
jgi:hypothetical protein